MTRLWSSGQSRTKSGSRRHHHSQHCLGEPQEAEVAEGNLSDSGLSAIGLAQAMTPPRGPGPQSTVIDTWQAEPLSGQAKVLESVIECLPDGVIVADRSGRFLIFNNAAEQIFGTRPRDVPSTDWAQTYGYFLPDGVTLYPNDQLPLVRALRGEEVSDAEIFVRNGQVPEGRWINASALPWRDETGAARGALLVFRDVSDTKRSGELNERLSSVVEQTADSVIITESSGKIVYVNPAFERTTGYSPKEALGRTPRLLNSGQHDREFFRELWDTVLGGEVYRGTLVNRRKNGELFHAEQTITPIAGPDGRSEYLVSVARDITERLRNERHQAQLEAARAIQQRLYPREAPQVPGFDIAGAVHPADSLCGDYYDFFPMPGGCLGMTIADVMGHGVGPSILMAQARAYLRSFALTHADVGEILRRLNDILTVEGSQREFVTQILLRLDPDAGTLVYTNAGHPSGFLLDRNGDVREELRSGGIPLGLFSDRPYLSSRAIRLEPGELLVLFTDGIIERGESAGGEFGTGRVLETMKRHRRDAASRILEALYEAASGFCSDEPQLDDMTAVVCKVEG
ncbi:MAG: PAS domain S-box protein [Acidobacteria bacterium]|nr:MAG: PAS domain S-box protein [Acidobacteriota bacterium]